MIEQEARITRYPISLGLILLLSATLGAAGFHYPPMHRYDVGVAEEVICEGFPRTSVNFLSARNFRVQPESTTACCYPRHLGMYS